MMGDPPTTGKRLRGVEEHSDDPQGASDDDRREEVFLRHPPMGLAEEGTAQLWAGGVVTVTGVHIFCSFVG